MEKLPTDIVDNILCRLPIEISLQAKRVCKIWRIFLRTKTDKVGLLVTAYYKSPNDEKDKKRKNKLYYSDHMCGKMNYSYTYDAFDSMDNGKDILEHYRMLGSCNGLVCFGRRSLQYLGETFIICNPLTGGVVYAPKLNTSILPVRHTSGFGYCNSTNEYKIVRLYSQEARKNEYHVQVYTVGTDEWRNKESIHILPLDSAGIYENGALHWMHYWRHCRTNQQHEVCAIITFDLEDEKFQFIPLPLLEGLNHSHLPMLLKGVNLYFAYTFDGKHTDIWAYKKKTIKTTNGCDMKENYGDKNMWHWIKEFRIEWEEGCGKYVEYFEPLALTRNNEVLLGYMCSFYCYDLKTATLAKLFDVSKKSYTMTNVIPHANSIVCI